MSNFYTFCTPSPRAAGPAVQRHDLFPTRIWQVYLTDLLPRIPDWVVEIQAVRAASPVSGGRSNRLGWNSPDLTLLQAPAFADLDVQVRCYCTLALKEMGVPDPVFDLDSWANIHDRGGFNFLHMHDGCLVSGCFYLQAPDGSAGLRFRDPRPGVLNAFAKGPGPNANCDMDIAPDPGMLVIFPHWLEHYVEPHENDVPRISIAFNARKG